MFLSSCAITVTKKAIILSLALSQKTNDSLGDPHIGDCFELGECC